MNLILIVFLLILPPESDVIDNTDKVYELAIENYENANYDIAITYFEELEAKGLNSEELFYNMGNAEFKLGNIGKSILYFEKVLKLNPKHKYASENLQFVSLQKTDKIEEQPGSLKDRIWKNNAFRFTANGWTRFFLMFIWLFCLSILLMWIGKKPWMKRLGFVLVVALFVPLIISSLFSIGRHHFDKKHGHLIVLQEKTPVMNRAQQNSKTKFHLNEGLKVEVVKKEAEWYLVKIGDGREGWLSQNVVGEI